MEKRDQTRQIRVGGLLIGGDAPVTVQTMCSTKTWDVEATVAQIRAMQADVIVPVRGLPKTVAEAIRKDFQS